MSTFLTPVVITLLLVALLWGVIRTYRNHGVRPTGAVLGVMLVAAVIAAMLLIAHAVLGTNIGFIHWPRWVWVLLVVLLALGAVLAVASSPEVALLAAFVAFLLLYGGVAPAEAKPKEASAESCAKQKHKKGFDAESKQCVPICNAVTTYHAIADANGNHCYGGPVIDGTTSTTKPADCGVDGIKEVDKPHDNGQVDSNGLPKGTPQQKRDYLLASMGKADNGSRTADPTIVMLYWNYTTAGASEPVTDPHQLVDSNGCFNARGRQVANDSVAVFKEAAVVADDAPATAVNTGADASGPFQEPSGQITGDRSGIRMTLPSGKKVWVMNRCVNGVTVEEVKGVRTKSVSTTVATVVTNQTTTTRPGTTVTTSGSTTTTRPGTTVTTTGGSTTTSSTVPTGPTTTKGPVNLRGPQHQNLGDNAAAAVAPTSGFTPSGNATVEAAQHTTDQAATSGNVATPSGVNTGSHENNSNTPVSADTLHPETPPGSNAGISAPVTSTPDSGQTTAAPLCDPSSC